MRACKRRNKIGAMDAQALATASKTSLLSHPGLTRTVQTVPPTLCRSTATANAPGKFDGGVSVSCGSGKSWIGGCKN